MTLVMLLHRLASTSMGVAAVVVVAAGTEGVARAGAAEKAEAAVAAGTRVARAPTGHMTCPRRRRLAARSRRRRKPWQTCPHRAPRAQLAAQRTGLSATVLTVVATPSAAAVAGAEVVAVELAASVVPATQATPLASQPTLSQPRLSLQLTALQPHLAKVARKAREVRVGLVTRAGRVSVRATRLLWRLQRLAHLHLTRSRSPQLVLRKPKATRHLLCLRQRQHPPQPTRLRRCTRSWACLLASPRAPLRTIHLICCPRLSKHRP